MGLLDSLFDSNSYGGQGGGLLDMLKNMQTQQQYQPSAGFAPQEPQGSGRTFDNALFSPSAYAPTTPQASPIDVGGYQMPRIGLQASFTPDPAALPANAQPAQGAGLPMQAPQQQTLPTFMGGPQPQMGLGDRLSAGLQNFAGADGLLPALAGGIGGLISGNRTDKAGMAQQNLKAQYDALVPTLGPQKAMLAVMNPEAGKTLLQEALTNKEKWGEVGSDSFGNKQYGWINDREQTINGKPMGADGRVAGAPSGGGFLNEGVKGVDQSLKGSDYLNQFSPEVQASVRNYIDGKSTPTGNPRKGFTQTVKMIAQKVGEDTGQSVDDTTFAARKQMRSQLSSSAPSSLGGQINIGNTAAGHLADLTEQALKLDNSNGFGIPAVAGVINSARGMLSTDQAAKMESLKGAAQHYGQEITKFYAGSPGGVAERDRFIESVGSAKSPKELAAILQTEGELMRSRLDALGGQIKGVLGEEGMKQYPVLRPDGHAALVKVEENVSRLKNGGSAPETAKTTTAPDRPAIEAEMRRRGLIK